MSDTIKAPEGDPARIYNRQTLVADVAEKTGLPRAKALAAVEAVFALTSHALATGKEVRVLGFGTFVVAERKASKGRNPQTGAEIDIPEAKIVRFRPGKVLRDTVDGGEEV
jgi:DNA-binding protein HU-beta